MNKHLLGVYRALRHNSVSSSSLITRSASSSRLRLHCDDSLRTGRWRKPFFKTNGTFNCTAFLMIYIYRCPHGKHINLSQNCKGPVGTHSAMIALREFCFFLFFCKQLLTEKLPRTAYCTATDKTILCLLSARYNIRMTTFT